LRQLKQRIALRSQLQPLNLDETTGYIQRRLQLAGANSNASVLFPAETVVRVHRHSRGIPRLINTVCENALITAYARQARSVTPDIIEDIAADFRLGVVHQPTAEAGSSTEEGDARRAAKTLLLLHDYLQKLQSSHGEPRAAAATGASKHEPYI
jgi:general secretion pathway protein A